MARASIICLVSFLFCAFAAQEIYNTNQKYSPQQLKEDFFIFRTALEESHPGMYTFHNKNYMDSVFTTAFNQLDKEKSEIELVRILAKVVAQIGCGHTAVTASDDFWDLFVLHDSVLFPIQIRFIDKKMYVREDLTKEKYFPTGTEIKSINGRKIDDLIKLMFPMISGDGYIETSKYVQLNLDFVLYYAALVETPKTFKIACVLPTGETKTVTIKSLSLSALRKNVKELQKQKKAPQNFKNLRLKIYSDSSIAVLTVHTFSHNVLRQNGEQFKSFMKKAFYEIEEAGVKNLIIDLRWNSGGEDTYEAYLYGFLADSAFRIYKRNYMTTQKKFSYGDYVDKPYRYNIYKKLAVETDSNTNEFKWLKMDKWQKPKKENHFSGKVCVLINGGTFSAASSFASMANNYKRATFFGEETGGEYYSCNGDVYPQITLPNTGIKLRMPLVKNIFDVKSYPIRGRGVMPDYPIERTLDDMKNNKDTELKYTIDYILKTKSEK